MKKSLYGFAMCQSMFCAIPWPFPLWDEGARDRMLLFLPLIGLEVGGLWAGLDWLCRILELPWLIRGFLLCAWPFLATGFLHLDGFMDVTDAVKSCRDLTRRRQILKDSHVGSFAVIGCGLLLLAQFAAAASVPEQGNLPLLLLLPGVSRCCSALAVTVLPPMSTSQYAHRQESPGRIAWLTGLLCCLLGLGFFLDITAGIGLIACLVGYGLSLLGAYRSLAGMNGDIAGYALTIGELTGLAIYAVI